MRNNRFSMLRSWMTHAACGAGAIVGAGLLSPAASEAQFTYDLRFSDGSSDKVVAGPGNLTVELWARVSGTDTDHTNDAFHSGFVVLQSSETNGGVFNGALMVPFVGGPGTRVSPFAGVGSQSGSGSDLNSDGVGDWGSLSMDENDAAYMRARSSEPTYGGASVGQAVNANTWEFKIGMWKLQVDSLIANPSAGASTQIAITQPSFATTGSVVYATYFSDDADPFSEGGSTNVTEANAASVYGDFITITVPEPASLAGLAIGGLALLSRRRGAK